MGKKTRSGSGMSEGLEKSILVKILKFFDADADPGILLTLDPGWKEFRSGIRDKHAEIATLQPSVLKAKFPYNNASPLRNSTYNIRYT
jgi:hypothetical protein